MYRAARREETPHLVGMLIADALGQGRERLADPLPPSYYAAYDAINADPNQELMVAEHRDSIVALMQISYIPGLTYEGGWRAQIEGVRVAESMRGQGVGHRFLEWAVERARSRGCRLVQLTSDKQRSDALRFYESLGFVASHEGFKLHLG
ncbi:GNAT family acetyltransferase [Acidobacteria bacterium Mor1]|nr:GNAT family acetyltransferase [Acidobacteria bacterium Mor1]